MEMSVHSRKFALCSKADEPLVTDDRNNNMKNDRITKKQQTVSSQENNESTSRWNQTDELRLTFQNSEQNMDKHSSDTHSNDSQSSGPVENNKTAINFSVESILNGSNCTKKCDTENGDQKSLGRGHSPQKSSIPEDCSRIFKPMPMRYVSNPTVYHGKG